MRKAMAAVLVATLAGCGGRLAPACPDGEGLSVRDAHAIRTGDACEATFDVSACDGSSVAIQGATVSVTDGAGNRVESFTRLSAGSLDATSGSPSRVNLGNVCGSSPGDRLHYAIRWFGQAQDGAHVESVDVEVPVGACCASTGP